MRHRAVACYIRYRTVAKEWALTIRSIHDLAAAIRGRRTDLGMSQAELAKRTGVSRKWIYEFEAGKPTAELGLLLRVLDALGLGIELTPSDCAADAAQATVDLDAVIEEHRA
jgi:HTH-type transcriptional regulator / antitoxin HipB